MTIAIPPALALSRFGLGPRRGDLARLRSDPQGALVAEVKRRVVAQPFSSELMASDAAIMGVREENERRRVARAAMAASTPEAMSNAGPPGPMAAGGAPAPSQKPEMRPEPEPVWQASFRAEAMARFALALEVDTGFIERLVWFWSNHFAVSVAKDNQVRATVGALEREAIRPNVLGGFADLLRAVETHPAMLIYLDNQASIGPNSKAGVKQPGRGLNENLAREILELHSLGVAAGYSQGDVTSLARLITGWSIAGADGKLGRPGSFAFSAYSHEPGGQTVLSRAYSEGGAEQGVAALNDIARHPATAKHIAFKLARHFVADQPPPSLVDGLAKVFRDSDGDLSQVALTLLRAPESWEPAAAKLRSPYEFLVAAHRLTGRKPDNLGQLTGPLAAMGQPLWDPPAPIGFSDLVDTLATPQALRGRLDVAAQLASRSGSLDPKSLLDEALGDLASPQTREAVLRADSRQQGIALLFMSPEFQRR